MDTEEFKKQENAIDKLLSEESLADEKSDQ